MAAISSEISRAESAEDSLEVALSTEVSYLLANTDLTSIDSFAEIVADLSSEVSRAESVEADLSVAIFDEIGTIAQHIESNLNDSVNMLIATYYQKLTLNGDVDGTNQLFLFDAPYMVNSESIYLNGLLMTEGDDYSYNGPVGGPYNGIVFINAPQVGDKVKAYAVQGPSVPMPV